MEFKKVFLILNSTLFDLERITKDKTFYLAQGCTFLQQSAGKQKKEKRILPKSMLAGFRIRVSTLKNSIANSV